MSGLDKNRYRNSTVSFRVTPEERQQLEARIKVSGMTKGTYFIESLLHQKINIVVGKYQSDRLSLEIRRLREQIENLGNDDDKDADLLLKECKVLLAELYNIVAAKENGKLKISDFAETKRGGEF